jgi:Major tropism determinant N-terminal domain
MAVPTTNTTIQFRRGNKADLPTEAMDGEPLFCLDSQEIYFGMGPGQPLAVVRRNANALQDTPISPNPPADGNVLIYQAAADIYVPGPLPAPVEPVTKVLFVDGARADAYAPTGSSSQPFKTIMGAVNQILANGDNSASVVYLIQIAPAVYPEKITLSDPRLAALVFYGYGATVGGSNFSGTVLEAVNNDNLSDCQFFGLRFVQSGASNPFFNFTTATKNTNFASGALYSFGIAFFNCSFVGGGAANVTAAANFLLDACMFPTSSPPLTFTNVTVAIIRATGLSQGATVALVSNPAIAFPSGWTATQLQVRHSTFRGAVTIDAGSNYVLADAARQNAAVTVNGLFRNYNSVVTAPITVNSGGTYRTEAGGVHSSTLTINPGGKFDPLGTYAVGDLFFAGGTHLSAGAASNPNGAVMGNPGDLYLSTTGGSGATLWVKESGAGTNTGWLNK